MDQANINSAILGIVGVLLAGLIAWLGRASAAKDQRLKTLETQIAELRTQAAVVEIKVTPLWAKVQKQLSEDLHHPHEKNKEVDHLLEKLEAIPKPTITVEETARLKELLVHRSEDETVSASERASATIMATVMDKVLEESADSAEVKIELISRPVVEPKPDEQ